MTYMFVLDLRNPLVLLAALMVYAVLMILGKEYKKSSLPALSLGIFLVTLLVYGVQLFLSTNPETNKMLATCIGYNTILVFLSYISYLWIDDIESKSKKEKSIDNCLEWFWDKV